MATASPEARDLIRQLEPGPIPVVMWTFGDKRRAVLCAGPGEARELLRRVMSRFRGGARDHALLTPSFRQLAEPDRAVTTRYGSHILSIVRPYVFGASADGAEPTLISIAGPTETPRWPILFPDLHSARAWAAQLRDRGIAAKNWRKFELELSADGGGKLRFSAGPSLRTELESELISRFGPDGRERQRFSLAGPSDRLPGRRPRAA